MTDLSGITVTAGIIHPQQREALAAALDRIGGRLIDTVRIDTTHFVCTEGRGPLWEKAVDMNIPVVRPEWVDACEAEGTIVSVRGYYLNADPKTRQLGPMHGQHQQTGSVGSVATIRSRRQTQSSSHHPQSPQERDHPAGESLGGQQKPEEHEGSSATRGEPSTQSPAPPPKDEIQGPKETPQHEPHDHARGDESEAAETAPPHEEAKKQEQEDKPTPEEEEPGEEEPATKADHANSTGEKNGKQREGDSELSDVPL